MRTQLFSAMRDIFRRLASGAPLVLVIDDLQWADADSLALLANVLGEPEAPPLLLVATVRAGSTGEAAYAKASALAARLGGDVRGLHVGALPPEEARALAESLMEDGGPDATPEAISIAKAAGGHPMFIDELVRQRRMREGRRAGAAGRGAPRARIEADHGARHVSPW